jgi:fatty acid desaturase
MAAQGIEWYRVPVERDALREYTRKSDLRGWLQAGSFLLIFACTSAAATWLFLQRLWLPMVLVCYLHSVFHQMVGMAAAVHELSHGTAFKSKAANELFYYLFCFLTWNNPVHFRTSHMLHHQYTLFAGQDKEVLQPPVKDKLNGVNWLRWTTFDFVWFWLLVKTMVLHALGRGDVDYFSWDPLFTREDPRRAAMIRWARIALIGYAVLIAVFIVFKLWVLIYLIVLGSFFATILGNLTGSIQHTGLSSSVPDWRLICHTVKVNPVVRYLYWNMNFHTEHHMYAAVPFWQLPRFYARVSPGMQNPQQGFLAALRLLFQIKGRQRKDPSYTYVPEFPKSAAAPKWK